MKATPFKAPKRVLQLEDYEIYGLVDRSTFGPGPWDGEPDFVAWMSYSKHQCAARRSVLGAWCGYVRLPPVLPWKCCFEEDDVQRFLRRMPHQGLSFFKDHHELAEGLAGPGMWIGFDCAHAGDFIPSVNALSLGAPGTYRDLAYVTSETERLAVECSLAEYHERRGSL